MADSSSNGRSSKDAATTSSSARGGRVMSDAERLELAAKLDSELEEHIAKLPKRPYADGFTLDNMDAEMQQHPAFRTEPIDAADGQELPPLIEAMRQLKYDPQENSAEELAMNYKQDGNHNFKFKKYRWAIDAYTAGIKVGCQDCELNVQLLTNRAAANYRLGNYRSSLKDCERALRIKTDHVKAVVRAAECCFEMERYDESISWCNVSLKLNKEEKTLKDVKKRATDKKTIADRNYRKRQYEDRKSEKKVADILDAIRSRGIRMTPKGDNEDDRDRAGAASASESVDARVHLDDEDIGGGGGGGLLVWPVLFVYPEYAQSDLVRDFRENEKFVDHLSRMFGPECDRPGWDAEQKYLPANLNVYFNDDGDDRTLWEINPIEPLIKILQHPRYVVCDGAPPSFVVLVKDSAFQKDFLERYDEVKRVGFY